MTANAGISSKGFSASVDDTFLKTMEFRGKLNPKEMELIDELVEKYLAAGKKD